MIYEEMTILPKFRRSSGYRFNDSRTCLYYEEVEDEDYEYARYIHEQDSYMREER